MPELRHDPDFQQWIRFVFDHQVTDPEWYWDRDAQEPEVPPGVTLSRLINLFENASEVLAPYSEAQANQGLWYLASPVLWGHLGVLWESSIPWADRRHCLDAIHALFEKYFAIHCSDHLSHLDRGPERPVGVSPLVLSCFMWWDHLSGYGPLKSDVTAEDPKRIDAEFLRMMQRILWLPSAACVESALHGLGHWHEHFPEEVEKIVLTYLESCPHIPQELREYGLKAAVGDIH